MSTVGLLGDTPARDYAHKLTAFNTFAAPELRGLIDGLRLTRGQRVLDAGCGTGEALQWLWDAVQPSPRVAGVDLSAAHVEAARRQAPAGVEIAQGDLLTLPYAQDSFDLVWCVNTLNHLRDPLDGILRLKRLLRAGGRLAIGQSALLPDMLFAWDSRLERVVNEAVRCYYRERYGLAERDLAGVRGLLGWMRRADFSRVAVRTVVLERVAPLDAASHAYIAETIFQNTFGARLAPFLDPQDAAELAGLCDPENAGYALRRADFHFLQTFTLVVGSADGVSQTGPGP